MREKRFVPAAYVAANVWGLNLYLYPDLYPAGQILVEIWDYLGPFLAQHRVSIELVYLYCPVALHIEKSFVLPAPQRVRWPHTVFHVWFQLVKHCLPRSGDHLQTRVRPGCKEQEAEVKTPASCWIVDLRSTLRGPETCAEQSPEKPGQWFKQEDDRRHARCRLFLFPVLSRVRRPSPSLGVIDQLKTFVNRTYPPSQPRQLFHQYHWLPIAISRRSCPWTCSRLLCSRLKHYSR